MGSEYGTAPQQRRTSGLPPTWAGTAHSGWWQAGHQVLLLHNSPSAMAAVHAVGHAASGSYGHRQDPRMRLHRILVIAPWHPAHDGLCAVSPHVRGTTDGWHDL